MDLKRNLFDNIKECEMKIGYREEDMNLYYPRESLMELLLADQEHLSEEIAAFCRLAAQELGDVTIKETEEKGRYCIHIPFLKVFLNEIFKPGNTVADIVNIFRTFSRDVTVEKINEEEWGISFQDPEIDPYVYYLEQDAFGLQYHRFTKQAYDALKGSI